MSEWIATHGLPVLSVVCASLLFEVVRCWLAIMNLKEQLHDQRNCTINWMIDADACKTEGDENE